MNERILHWFVLLLSISLLSACASSVERTAPASSARANGEKVGAVTVALTPSARAALTSGVTVDEKVLAESVVTHLRERGLYTDQGTNSIGVSITDARLRSTAAAMMLGFMAGNDRLGGEVTVTDKEGAVLDRFKVSASYALGGLAGGMEGSRLSWLYAEFGKQTAAALGGDKPKT